MKQPPYLFAAILLVVLSIALLAYFLGKEHGEVSGLRIQKQIDRAEVKALQVRIDSLSVVYSDALARFNSRQPEEVKQAKKYANEQQRYHDERKALDTAGAATVRHTLLWTNQH